MEKLRLSLAVPTEPRSSEYLDKDSCMTNAFIDIDPIQNAYIVKRPGFYVGIEGITSSNRGLFWSPNPSNPGLYLIKSNNEPIFYPYLGNSIFGAFWSSSTTYYLGDDPVYYDEGDGTTSGPWYLQVPSASGISPNDATYPAYWSLTPPSQTFRYFGVNSSGTQFTPLCGSAEAAGNLAWSMFETYKSCAGKNPATNSWAVYSHVAAINIYGFPYTWYATTFADTSQKKDCSSQSSGGPNNRGGVAVSPL